MSIGENFRVAFDQMLSTILLCIIIFAAFANNSEINNFDQVEVNTKFGKQILIGQRHLIMYRKGCVRLSCCMCVDLALLTNPKSKTVLLLALGGCTRIIAN